MAEILVKTLTRHRDILSEFYMKDWTAFDVVNIMPDGFYSGNKHSGAKGMGIVLKVPGDIPADYHRYEQTKFNDYLVKEYGRSKYIIDLTTILTKQQLKDCFNHNLLVNPIAINQSYIDLFISRDQRTTLHPYDKSGSFDNETVDVGPNGHADANTWSEFESNVAISVGGVIGDCDEDYVDTTNFTITGTGCVSGKILTFTCSGAGRHSGVWTTSAMELNMVQGMIISDPYVTIDGFQISVSNIYTTGIDLNNSGANGSYIAKNCILKGVSSGGKYGIRLNNIGTGGLIYNNILYDFTGDNLGDGISENTSNSPSVYNNTVINCDGAGIRIEYTAANIRNNLCQANATDYVITDVGGTISKNVSEDATSPDAAYRSKDVHTNSVFKNYGADDYRLDSGGDVTNLAILDDGDDLSGVFTDDIEGQTRDTWYIGASEIVAVGGISVPIAWHHLNKNIGR